MLSRRLIRVKTSHILYAYFKSVDPSINKFEKELFFSFNKTHELYHYLLLLIIEIKKHALARINLARNKHVLTHEDLNPNLRFVNSKVISQLESNYDFKKYMDEKKISWLNYPVLIKDIYQIMVNSEVYKNYMNGTENSYASDKKFVIEFYLQFLDTSELLYQILEEQSIYWNDDVEFIINMIIKTLKSFKEEEKENSKLMPLFKNQDDRDFAKNLFRKTILNHNEYNKLIAKHTRNWDIQRIAFMDILFMQLTIAEVVEFPSIPIKVSLNEYIEIIKYYSTKKSSTFINGILDKIINSLKEEGKIKKTGRGLIS